MPGSRSTTSPNPALPLLLSAVPLEPGGSVVDLRDFRNPKVAGVFPSVVPRAHDHNLDDAAVGDDNGAKTAWVTARDTIESFAAGLSEVRRGPFLAAPAVAEILAAG